jgi:hypothetical protein
LLDDDGAPTLVQLPKAYDVLPELRDVIHPLQPPMFARLAKEEDCASAFDLHDGAITEFDRTTHPEVDFGERGSDTTHVVGGSGVEDPAPVVVIVRGNV